MKAFGTVGFVIAGVLLAGTAMAQAPGGGMGMGAGFGDHRPPMERAFGPHGDGGRWWNNPKLIERLKITDEQRKAFDVILLEHRTKLIDLRASLEKAELALEPMMREDQPNEAGILAQIDKVAQARAELEKANARFLLDIRGKLTPEQRKLLEADRDRHGDRGGWGGRGQGPNGQGPNGPGERGQYHRQMPPSPPATPGEGAQGPPPAPGAGNEQ